MNWKDTVISPAGIDAVKKQAAFSNYYWNEFSITTAEHMITEAQAEVAFKTGVKEVVEWIKERGLQRYLVWEKCLQADERIDEVYSISPKDLQDKLKEWGVDPTEENGYE